MQHQPSKQKVQFETQTFILTRSLNINTVMVVPWKNIKNITLTMQSKQNNFPINTSSMYQIYYKYEKQQKPTFYSSTPIPHKIHTLPDHSSDQAYYAVKELLSATDLPLVSTVNPSMQCTSGHAIVGTWEMGRSNAYTPITSTHSGGYSNANAGALRSSRDGRIILCVRLLVLHLSWKG